MKKLIWIWRRRNLWIKEIIRKIKAIFKNGGGKFVWTSIKYLKYRQYSWTITQLWETWKLVADIVSEQREIPMKVGQIFYTCASSTTLFTVFWWEFFSFPFTSLSFHFNWQIFRTLVFLKEDFSGTSRYCSYHTELIVFFFKFKLSICTIDGYNQINDHNTYKEAVPFLRTKLWLFYDCNYFLNGKLD